MQFDQTTIFILGTAVIIGSWIVVNQLNRARERETREEARKDAARNAAANRQNALLKFLATLEQEIRAGIGRYHEVAKTFDERKLKLIELTNGMKSDYTDAAGQDFATKIKTITDMTGGGVSNTELDEKRELKGVKTLLMAVTALITFVEAN
jgi:hypothetical protein